MLDASAIAEIEALRRRRLDTVRAWKTAEYERRAALEAIRAKCEEHGISTMTFSRLARGVTGKRIRK